MCGYCGGAININESYSDSTIASDGRVYQFRAHDNCSVLADAYYKEYSRYPEDESQFLDYVSDTFYKYFDNEGISCKEMISLIVDMEISLSDSLSL
ncbi:MAG: hypothetical protein ACRCTZ_23195 [Sarcina sp.]